MGNLPLSIQYNTFSADFDTHIPLPVPVLVGEGDQRPVGLQGEGILDGFCRGTEG